MPSAHFRRLGKETKNRFHVCDAGASEAHDWHPARSLVRAPWVARRRVLTTGSFASGYRTLFASQHPLISKRQKCIWQAKRVRPEAFPCGQVGAVVGACVSTRRVVHMCTRRADLSIRQHNHARGFCWYLPPARVAGCRGVALAERT